MPDKIEEAKMQENTMVSWMQQLDRLLRGDATRLSALRKGTIELPESGLTLVILVLGLLYGGCMGCFALLNRPTAHAVMQLVSSMAKVPCLFFLTLLVTFPSLYVFNALVGSRLSLSSVWRLMIAMMAVMMAILASLGPIVAFFSLSTNNYGFMLMLNVAVFALSGFLGLKFLLHTLHRLSTVLSERPTAPAPPTAPVPHPAVVYPAVAHPAVADPAFAPHPQAAASCRAEHAGQRDAARPSSTSGGSTSGGSECGGSECGSWRSGSDGGQDAGIEREDGVLLLDLGLRLGRDADELGLEALHRQPRAA